MLQIMAAGCTTKEITVQQSLTARLAAIQQQIMAAGCATGLAAPQLPTARLVTILTDLMAEGCAIGVIAAQQLSTVLSLTIQLNDPARAGPVEHNRLARPVVCETRNELELQADPFAAAVQGLGEIQSRDIKVANDLIFR